ncbi:hypothetical protein [Fibrobacter intestinalis]|uniref:hypothetical protein n=1 Tax=Fibrobacter intestinalis TaxID=28122 RepID=UPI001FCF8F6E|nr:hypothetical protein [Fibrobacter intestinalis]
MLFFIRVQFLFASCFIVYGLNLAPNAIQRFSGKSHAAAEDQTEKKTFFHKAIFKKDFGEEKSHETKRQKGKAGNTGCIGLFKRLSGAICRNRFFEKEFLEVAIDSKIQKTPDSEPDVFEVQSTFDATVIYRTL